MIFTYKYRIYPTKSQSEAIDFQLAEACRLYNAALEHRIWCYRQHGISVSYFNQCLELKYLRKEKSTSITNATVAMRVLKKLDKTYVAFFKRKNGFPRFKSRTRYNDIEYRFKDGCHIREKKLCIGGIGNLKVEWHREIQGIPKACKIARKNGKYYACFSCEAAAVELPIINKAIGIDVGIESFATTSKGEHIKNPRFYQAAQAKLRRLQRNVARKKKGSNSRKQAVKILAKHHEKIANQRLNFLHNASRKIVNDNDIIAIEKLNIKGLARGILAKQVNDVGWGIFFNMLSYKAESAGRKLIKVNPAGTSQICHQCGNVAKKDLSVRWHECVCGCSIHRDINSAKVILGLATSLHTLTYGNSQSVVC